MSDVDARKIKQLDGSLLLVLRELLRHRRATVAARRMGLSQSAVSHALARLRELFGDPLFVRKSHGLEPTRHALQLAPRIDALLMAMHDAMGLPARFDPTETTRSFRIGAPDYVTTLLAPTLLTCFAKHAPRARFVFSQRIGRDAQLGLLRDEFDVVLGRFGECEEGVVMEPLFEDRYCVVARRDHPGLRRPLNAERLAELEHVQVSMSADFRVPDFIALEWGKAGLSALPRVVASVPRFSIALAVVERTEAVAIVPERIVLRQARKLGLRVHALPFSAKPIVVRIARRARPDAGVAFLLEQLRSAAAETDVSTPQSRRATRATKQRPS